MKGTHKSSRRIRIPAGFIEPLETLFDEVAPAAQRLGLNVYLVGGAVRDLVQGNVFSGEFDIVVLDGADESAEYLAREILRARGGGEPVSFPRFGNFLVPGPPYNIELTQARLRSALPPLSPDPLVADALARDFTLNALFIKVDGALMEKYPSILDPTGRGLSDLAEGKLRTPVCAHWTFQDDPLRVFRTARFKACNLYRMDPSIGRAARIAVLRSKDLAPERIMEEMNRILLSRHPSLGLEILARWNAFDQVMPEIQNMVGFRQDNPFHFPDLFKHTMRVVDRCPVDLPLRWAALLHDCGKPSARVVSEEGECYHGHEAVGAELAAGLLRRLKAGRRMTSEVSDLIRLHMVHYRKDWSDRAVRRFIHRSGDHLQKLLALVEADSASLKLRRTKLREINALRQRMETLIVNMPEPSSPLSGKQIMETLRIEPGLDVGRAKKALVEAVVEGDIPAREEAARSFLLHWWQSHGGS